MKLFAAYPYSQFYLIALEPTPIEATTTATATKTSLKKVNLRCLKLYRAYSISFHSSNVGNFF